MDKVSKKSLKTSNENEKKVERKIKSLMKSENLPDLLNQTDKEVNDEFVGSLRDVLSPKDIQEHNAIVINLPSEATKDELINFLSNRGIAINNLLINENKYAIIESEDVNTVHKITKLLLDKPMENNIKMRAIQLSGNQLRLSNFNAKNSVANKAIIIVKNINVDSKMEDVLAIISHKEEILKKHSVKVRSQGNKTVMLTVEFKSSEFTNKILQSLNGTELDGHILNAEYKYTLVDCSNIESVLKTNTLIIRNLPLTGDRDYVKELIKNFNVSLKNIHVAKKLIKNCCYIKFNSIKEATEAYNMLLEEVVEGGVRLDVKYLNLNNGFEFENTKLTITNLPFTIKKEDIEKEFDMIESIKFPLNESGKPRGCCYLTFSSAEMAILANDSFQDKVMGGRKIKCGFSKANGVSEKYNYHSDKTLIKSTKEKQVGNVLTLFNLPAGVTSKDIIANFSNVKLVNVVKKGESFKGIAEVHFKDSVAASVALSIPEFSLKGRVIRKELKGGVWRNGTVPKKVKKPTIKNEESRTIDNSDSEPMQI